MNEQLKQCYACLDMAQAVNDKINYLYWLQRIEAIIDRFAKLN